MAHFAELDADNKVVRVVVVNNKELIDDGVESESKGIAFLLSIFGHKRWVQTSYSGSIRKNFAGVGMTYDSDRDAFIPPRPFASWTLDEATCRWVAPSPMPSGGLWRWDESAVAWVAAAADPSME